MTKLFWLVENFDGSDTNRRLVYTICESGRSCFEIQKDKYLSFSLNSIETEKLILFHGSMLTGRWLNDNLKNDHKPLVLCSEGNYNCSLYYPFFKGELFNDKYIILKLSDLKRLKFEIYSEFGKEAVIFVRPNVGEKIFAGQLLDLQDFDRFWKNDLAGGQAKDDDLALVSTPKTILSEFRFVVSQSEIIASSCYQMGGQLTLVPGAPAKAIDLVNKLLKINYKPDLIFCIDVVEDQDHNFWLLELTSFSYAGLYACDLDKVVDRVSNIVESAYNK